MATWSLPNQETIWQHSDASHRTGALQTQRHLTTSSCPRIKFTFFLLRVKANLSREVWVSYVEAKR